MRKLRIWAVILSVVLLGSGVEACGTSQPSSREEPEEWTDLLPDSVEESRLEQPQPSRNIVKPRLEPTVQDDTGKRVTGQYKSELLGTWDGQTSGYVYEFRGDESLDIQGKGWSNTFTYWVQEEGRKIRLHIFDKDADQDNVYPFTKQGGEITLYDDTGSELDVLVRRVTATPMPSPSPVPSPSPSVAPSPSPSPAPSPSPSPTLSPAPVPEALQPSMGKIQCALDVLLDGGDFEDSFWDVVARYASLGKFPKEDDYAILTPEELETCVGELYAELEELPEIPSDSKVVRHKAADAAAGTPEQYFLQLGNLRELDLTVEGYEDEVAYIRVEDSSASRQFAVTLRDGALVSVEEQ